MDDAPRRRPVIRTRKTLTLHRKHVETITLGGDGQAQRATPSKLGTCVDNQRRRAATLTPEQLSKIGMRWA